MAMYPREWELAFNCAKRYAKKKDSKERIDSSCYFRDSKGKLHEFDFLEFIDGNLIISKSKET